MMLNMPITAMKIDTSIELKPIFSCKYTKMHEYWPASGKYDRNTVMQCIRIVLSRLALRSAANGSACSQLIGAPHELGRTFSDRLSGTATRMKNTSSTAMAVASATTSVSL